MTHAEPQRRLHRRTFLRAAGVSLALPLFDATLRRGYAKPVDAPDGPAPHRMLMICATMGVLPRNFFPKKAGRGYDSTPYLDILKAHRQRMTVMSGVSHPEVDGGHHADRVFLSAAAHPGASGFRNTISVDQYAAERIGHLTREPSLVLHAGPEAHKPGLSWTGSGVSIPAENKPSKLYRKLFLTGSKADVDARIAELKHGRSILDTVYDRGKTLARDLGTNDRHKLDEYFTGIRELEKRMVAAEAWEKTPKPKVDMVEPKDIRDNSEIVGWARIMYQMIKLAFQTDSTRIISLNVHSYAKVRVDGVQGGHHELTHHGNRPDALKQLTLIEEARLRELRDFLDSMAATEEAGGSLLDRTMVMWGSHMGDANRHTNDNLPVTLIGGGFRHGQHLAFDPKRNEPLCNLYVSMLQRMGIETDSFASSSGTLRGLGTAK